jgi:hypothetical protein
MKICENVVPQPANYRRSEVSCGHVPFYFGCGNFSRKRIKTLVKFAGPTVYIFLDGITYIDWSSSLWWLNK